MTTLDITIITIYLLGLFAFAIRVGLRETAEDFLVLSRRAPFVLVLFSVVSSWVGVGTTVATAASGYDTGISLGITAGAGGLVGVIVAGLIAPRLKSFGDRFRAHTIGDFFSVRYSEHNRLVVAGLILVTYSLLTAAQFVGLAMLTSVWSGVAFKGAVLFAAISTIIYTAFAGIKSDFYTDVIHFWIMVIVLFFLLLPIIMRATGGARALSVLPSSYFNPFAYGGVAFFAAGIVFGVGAVFVTMELWQRIYASATGSGARWALMLSGGIIICFYLLSAFLGMLTKVVEPNLAVRDQALFILMKRYLPPGVLGLGIAAFMAAFISAVNTMIMVTSATLTKDVYKGWVNRNATERQLLRAGRLCTLLAGVVPFVLAMAIPDIVALSVNALFMLLIMVPAVIGGFFWKRATAKGALLSISFGALAMAGSMWVAPKTAFVPGFLVSLLTFVGGSLVSSHDASETTDVWRGNPAVAAPGIDNMH
jgi:SSS family solute:Na+ symporter